MAKIEWRIGRLESKHGGKEERFDVVIRFVRPGDIVCVSEMRLVDGGAVKLRPFDGERGQP